MTITIQLLNEDAMALLLDLEKLNLLKLLLPESKQAVISKSKKSRANSAKTTKISPEQPQKSTEEKFKPGFGGARDLISLAPDWDEPLSELQEYMN